MNSRLNLFIKNCENRFIEQQTKSIQNSRGSISKRS